MQVGDLVDGRFLLEAVAGEGGMGTVFRARDVASGGAVALKLLRGAGGQGAARFEREARALAELRHPAIVRYVAHGVAGDVPYLAMEWLAGEDLAEQLRRRRPSIAESLAIARQIAAALGAAHEIGLIHRDVKPRNVFLCGGDPAAVRVLDFGLARYLDESGLTSAGAVLGTPGYMAPEQVRGERELTPAVDLFALGCVLFECLTGEPPFPGDGVASVLARILFEAPPRVCELRPEVPLAVDGLVARLLQKDPWLRQRDGAALGAELDEAIAALAVPAAPRAAPAALTARERRMVSVLVIAGGGTSDTVALDGAAAAAPDRLRAAVVDHGGRLERLADGSSVIAFSGGRAAADEVFRAAHCALVLRELVDRPMAVVTGQTDLGRRIPGGDAVDRARAALLASESAERLRGVMLDGTSERLLASRFRIEQRQSGAFLVGEQPGDRVAGAPLLLGRPSPFVGRDWELRTLCDAVDRTLAQGQPNAVLVTAPAGFGKTRLAYELTHAARRLAPGLELWGGRADSLQAGSTFALLGQTVRGALGIVEGAPLAERRARLEAGVRDVIRPSDRQRVREFLGELAGVRAARDEASPALRAARDDAALMGDQMMAAWCDLVAARTERAAVLLVLEDLHWGDPATVRFVDAALRDVRGPLFVLALARPEIHELFPKIWAARGALEIRLRELSRGACERLVREVLGDAVGEATRERVVARAAGHAFFLEELIRAASAGSVAELPSTVLAMVQARLDALESDARRVLRAASVFGETFWTAGVQALIGDAPLAGEVPRWLRALVERELVLRVPASRFPGSDELRFRHALLRDAVYATLPVEDRQIGHELAGDWLAAAGESDAVVLAEHFERGATPSRAAAWFRRAAEDANRGADSDATLALARRGLACEAPDEERIALHALLCEASGWRMQLGPCLEHADRVLADARPGSAPWERAATAKMGCALHLGRPEMFAETLAQVSAAAPEPDAVAAAAFALTNGAFVLLSAGQRALAEKTDARLDDVVPPGAAAEPAALAWRATLSSVFAHARDADPWAARHHALEARRRFESIRHNMGAVLADVLRAQYVEALGQHEEAERLVVGTLASGREVGLLSSLRPGILVDALLGQERIPEALDVAEAGAAEGRAAGLAVHEGRALWAHARAQLAAGRPDEALERIRAALALVAAVPTDVAAATATLASIQLARGAVDEALRAARASFDAIAAHDLPGHGGAAARLVFAEALFAAEETDEARAVVVAARRWLDERAARIGDEARAAFLERVPEHARTRWLAARLAD